MSVTDIDLISIVTVHFGDFFWIELLLKRLKDFTDQPYNLLIVNNDRTESSDTRLRQIAPAAQVLQFSVDVEEVARRGHDHGSVLDAAVATVSSGIIVVFDSDAHPIKSDWLPWVIGRLRTVELVAARDDHYDRACSHPCITAIRASTLREGLSFKDFRHDVGRMLSETLRAWGRSINLMDYRELWADQGRVYDERFYHHGKSSWYNEHNRSMLPSNWFVRSNRRRAQIARGSYTVPYYRRVARRLAAVACRLIPRGSGQ